MYISALYIDVPNCVSYNDCLLVLCALVLFVLMFVWSLSFVDRVLSAYDYVCFFFCLYMGCSGLFPVLLALELIKDFTCITDLVLLVSLTSSINGLQKTLISY